MIRYTSRFCLLLAAGIVLCAGPWSRAEEPAKDDKGSLNELSMEVAALQMLYQFEFTPTQQERLSKLARETADEIGPRQAAQASAEFRRALTDLRTALIEGNDERIDKLQQRLDKLREADDLELDDAIEVTDAARRLAPEVVKRLSARQVAGFLSYYGDQAPDPREELLEALDRVRGLNEKEWKALREQVSDDVARLVAGLDNERGGQISDQVVQWLIKVRALKDDEFKRERRDLEKEVDEIIGKLGPFDVLRHLVEQAVAELLSNPRLPAALEAQRRAEQRDSSFRAKR
jgi:hypothetical protein